MNDCVKINGKDFETMLSFGLVSLREKEDEVNKLNVFPVPDGDTGKNMRMTYEAGLNALKSASSEDIGEAANTFARGMLLGARGNSGVILSQIFKGIAVGLDGCREADCNTLCSAFRSGVEKSYKAVVKPVEGTILTVFRESCEEIRCKQDGSASLGCLFKDFSSQCEKALLHTPEQLAVLKEAGVVDSGGAGLTYIFKGFNRYFGGERLAGDEISLRPSLGEAAVTSSEEEYGYCTEFLLELSEETRRTFTVDEMVVRLESIGGQSIVALRDGDIVKVHVHVMTPGDVLNIAQSYGEFITIKIENMTLQHNELVVPASKKERLKVAAVEVASNDGFKNLFADLGADFVVCGGQSMNPSVGDFLKAFDTVNAEDVIVLPNNSNVIMTARQAGELYKDSRVHVIETGNLAQGYAATSVYNCDERVEAIVSEMTAAAGNVLSIEITCAVRDARCGGLDIAESDEIAISDGKIIGVGKDAPSAFSAALEKMPVEDKSVITVFAGADADDDGLGAITGFLAKEFPQIEVCTVKTDQPVYPYIIAIE